MIKIVCREHGRSLSKPLLVPEECSSTTKDELTGDMLIGTESPTIRLSLVINTTTLVLKGHAFFDVIVSAGGSNEPIVPSISLLLYNRCSSKPHVLWH